jgi:hypothetical protein
MRPAMAASQPKVYRSFGQWFCAPPSGASTIVLQLAV